MGKSMSHPYEQGEYGSFSASLGISTGFSLFWMLLFMAVLQTPLTNGSVGAGSINASLPVAACVGIAVADVAVHRWCDFFSRERGHKVLWAVVGAQTLMPGLVLLAHALKGPSAFDALSLPAWLFFGMGIACLLALWSELLVGFVKSFSSKTIALSACIGSVLYFVMNCLPSTISACFLCAAPAISLVTLKTLESELPSAPFVSRADSLKRHRLTKPIDTMNTMYGMAFGLILRLLWQTDPTPTLYFGTALAVAVGALIMLMLFKRNTNRMMHGTVQKILFPVLVAGLLPIPFVDEFLRPIFMLMILCGYICMMLVSLDSLYLLVRKFKVAPFYLVGRGNSPLIVGLGAGFGVAHAAMALNMAAESFIVAASLLLVIALSIVVTLIEFDKSYLANEQQDEDDGADSVPQGVDLWAAKCESVAKRHGLSARETEVFCLLARGRGAKFIEERLCISKHTVKSHVYKIHKKLGVSSREDLITLVECERLKS